MAEPTGRLVAGAAGARGSPCTMIPPAGHSGSGPPSYTAAQKCRERGASLMASPGRATLRGSQVRQAGPAGLSGKGLRPHLLEGEIKSI